MTAHRWTSLLELGEVEGPQAGPEPNGHAITRMRVIVVDDHQVFADAVAARLAAEPDFDVVGVAYGGAEAEQMVQRHAPDLIFLDTELGDADGVEMASRLLDGHSERRIIIATAHDDAGTACRAVRAGASGFVSKDAAFDDLLSAARGVMRGETWIPPHLLTAVVRELQGQNDRERELDSLMRLLTPRERDVLACMVSGLDRAGIAEVLCLSVDTVRTHTQNMFAKLNVHSSLEAVGLAVRAGLRPVSSHNDRDRLRGYRG